MSQIQAVVGNRWSDRAGIAAWILRLLHWWQMGSANIMCMDAWIPRGQKALCISTLQTWIEIRVLLLLLDTSCPGFFREYISTDEVWGPPLQNLDDRLPVAMSKMQPLRPLEVLPATSQPTTIWWHACRPWMTPEPTLTQRHPQPQIRPHHPPSRSLHPKVTQVAN
jgi:hypothetical protein